MAAEKSEPKPTPVMAELTLKVLLFRFQIEHTVPINKELNQRFMLPRSREAPLGSNNTRAAAQDVAAEFNPNNNYCYTNSSTLGMTGNEAINSRGHVEFQST